MLARELAHRVNQAHRYEEVAIGFLRCGPSVEEAASHIRSARIRLYPLFMSDGYYVREAIPRRLGIQNNTDSFGHRVSFEEPLGLNPRLPDVLLTATVNAALARGVRPNAAHLLVVAHGSSKSPHSAEVARRITTYIASGKAFASVEVGFLEEEPYFAARLAEMPRPLFVLGLFAGEGMHNGDDLHQAVDSLGDPAVHIVEQLGGYAGVIELVAASLL